MRIKYIIVEGKSVGVGIYKTYDLFAQLQSLFNYERSLKTWEKTLEQAIVAMNFAGDDKQCLLKYANSLKTWEKSFMEAITVMNFGGDAFSSSTINESLKNNLVERETEIKVLNQKKLENKKVQHLGCENEIQELKSQIYTL